MDLFIFANGLFLIGHGILSLEISPKFQVSILSTTDSGKENISKLLRFITLLYVLFLFSHVISFDSITIHYVKRRFLSFKRSLLLNYFSTIETFHDDILLT